LVSPLFFPRFLIHTPLTPPLVSTWKGFTALFVQFSVSELPYFHGGFFFFRSRQCSGEDRLARIAALTSLRLLAVTFFCRSAFSVRILEDFESGFSQKLTPSKIISQFHRCSNHVFLFSFLSGVLCVVLAHAFFIETLPSPVT